MTSRTSTSWLRRSTPPWLGRADGTLESSKTRSRRRVPGLGLRLCDALPVLRLRLCEALPVLRDHSLSPLSVLRDDRLGPLHDVPPPPGEFFVAFASLVRTPLSVLFTPKRALKLLSVRRRRRRHPCGACGRMGGCGRVRGYAGACSSRDRNDGPGWSSLSLRSGTGDSCRCGGEGGDARSHGGSSLTEKGMLVPEEGFVRGRQCNAAEKRRCRDTASVGDRESSATATASETINDAREVGQTRHVLWSRKTHEMRDGCNMTVSDIRHAGPCLRTRRRRGFVPQAFDGGRIDVGVVLLDLCRRGLTSTLDLVVGPLRGRLRVSSGQRVQRDSTYLSRVVEERTGRVRVRCSASEILAGVREVLRR